MFGWLSNRSQCVHLNRQWSVKVAPTTSDHVNMLLIGKAHDDFISKELSGMPFVIEKKLLDVIDKYSKYIKTPVCM